MALGRTVPLGRIPPAPLAMLAVEWVRRALAAMPAEFDAGTRLVLRIADAAEARVFDPASPADADLELDVHRWAEHNLLPRHAAQGFYFVVASMVRVAGIAHAVTNRDITLTAQNYLSLVRGRDQQSDGPTGRSRRPTPAPHRRPRQAADARPTQAPARVAHAHHCWPRPSAVADARPARRRGAGRRARGGGASNRDGDAVPR